MYKGRRDSNLDGVLGPNADWRARLHASLKDRWADLLRDIYLEQIRALGYAEFDDARIFGKEHPLYRLIVCSQHKTAMKIWRGIAKKKPDGQYSFAFE